MSQPYTERQERFGNIVIRIMSALNTWAFQWTGGRVGGRFAQGAPVLLLTTTGRKTGKPRTVPLIYLEDGENVVIVASKGGMNHHPVWFLNLEADPQAEIQIGREKRALRARRATEEEKAALWPRLTAMYTEYDTYQGRTERNIPVLILSAR